MANETASQTVEKTKKVSAKKVRKTAIEDLKSWLLSLDEHIKPTLHINGPEFPNCIITVDFGEPLTPWEFNNDQTSELTKKMKNASREIMKMPADGNVKFWVDAVYGIFWTSV